MSRRRHRSGGSPARTWSARLLLSSLALAAGAALGAVAGSRAPAERLDAYSWFDPLVDVQQLIAQRYVDEPPLAKMQQRALEAMVEALGDPYSRFIPKEDIAAFNKQVRGEYVGIGATVRLLDGVVTIVTPHAGSPALAAGVKPGDRVVAVDGQDVVGMAVDEVVELLTGEPGSSVRVTFERDGQRFERTIVRAPIVTRSVEGLVRRGQDWSWWLDPEEKIAYLRITHFGAQTGREFRAALTTLKEQGVRGLVLDLRFNGGGLVASAVEVVDALLDKGLIFSAKGRAHPETRVEARAETTILPTAPLAVLVNSQSASASEIVAGALKGDSRALIVGERTFGKGVMQATLSLPSGAGQLHLTEQRYYLPTGRPIHRMDDSTEWGVDPSDGYFLPMDAEQYEAMLEVRTELDAIHAQAPSPEDVQLPQTGRDPAWVRERLKDPQLALALEALEARLAMGAWPARTQEAPAATLAQAEELKQLRRFARRLEEQLERVRRRIDALTVDAPQADDAAEEPSSP